MDSKFIIAFFVLLAAGKTIMIISCLRGRKRSTSPSSSLPNARTTDMETGPEVLVEDPMTQRLVLAGEVAVDDRQQPEIVDAIRIPPPAYTAKDQHLEFENVPPPPTFKDAVPSSSRSPLSPFLHTPKPSRRELSQASSSGSQSNTSDTQQHRQSHRQLFRYLPASTDINNNNVNNSDNAAETVSNSESGVHRPAATAAVIEPNIVRIPNVARWVAESRRDTFQAFAGSSSYSTEQYPFDFVSTYSDSDSDSDHHSEPYGSSSSSGNMHILPSMGVLYPSVIVHM
ncbi:hypothetical protein EC957_000221 [Mortierella hygrophila]|uniref:Uncharacterized protein n=1 Tax=Mortierella hygrophila TaxID=979708 RepID=A0A9P6K7G2_9FUNG|nr:hypothetical protein EC957_000221 [Mortierella hygrophila]